MAATQQTQWAKEALLPQQSANSDGYVSDLDASAYLSLLDRPVPATANPVASDVHRRVEYRNVLRHHPDRGAGYYEYTRARYTRASLVETGRHAGRSRVNVQGIKRTILGYHIWKRDFFTSCINLRLPVAVAIMFAAYTLSFLSWGFAWWLLYLYDGQCLIGFKHLVRNSFVSAFLFATETQQTIGFGSRAPADCWISTWMVVFQSIWGQLLDAVVLGVIFARISYPKQRARTIFISDSAVIARRDSQLKFMFRIGDIRQSTVVSPCVFGSLYLWGHGHTTAEGEHIPVRMEALEFSYPQHLELLLPVVIEHTIDERSPLFGHTHESLQALGAEIVVTFEGCSESGDQFMARQSYLPDEVHWGFVFAPIIHRAARDSTRHTIDISRFHDIEPQRDLCMGPPGRLSSKVVAPPRGMVPYPHLTNNTLVLSDLLLLAPVDGKLCLHIRVGDTYPNNMLEVHLRAYIYRWRSRTTLEGDVLPFELMELDLGYSQGRDRLLLRLPVTVRHTVDDSSPLARWQSGPSAMSEDADSEIVVVVEGVQYTSSRNVMRQRAYSVHSDIKWGSRFAPCVTRPQNSPDGRPMVTWNCFHKILPLASAAVQTEEVKTAPEPAMAFGSVFDTAMAAAARESCSLAATMESDEEPTMQQQEDEAELSSTTLTVNSGHADWRGKRSLFNLSFDAATPDSDK